MQKAIKNAYMGAADQYKESDFDSASYWKARYIEAKQDARRYRDEAWALRDALYDLKKAVMDAVKESRTNMHKKAGHE